MLNDEQKQRRTDVFEEMPVMLERKPDFLDDVITGGESWAFQYDPEHRLGSVTEIK